MNSGILTGVVEGFYGRQWSWEARLACANFMSRQGLNSYLYCPKGDPWLRKQWQQAWPADHEERLSSLSSACREREINWGVGLSPYALYNEYNDATRARLREKIARIDGLGGRLLAILFDDMPGDCPDIAARQSEIVQDVRNWSEVEHLWVCPTWYSFDPQLERYFGDRPRNYWQELSSGLPEDTAVMWTGNQVCSESITVADLELIRGELSTPLVLWDNYPVNDGARASRYLHLAPLQRREKGLESQLAGHLCNPMNQAYLSHWPLTGLCSLYGGTRAQAEEILGAELSDKLERDAALFQDQGLDEIDPGQREQLAQEYRELGSPPALEVADWLCEGYLFDPECLTD